MLVDVGYVILGLIVALLSSFLGFGGGTIVVPLLPLIAGLDIKTTIATSLAVITLNAANNTFNFHKKKLVRWKLVFTISLGSIVFAIISSKLTHFFSENFVRWLVIAVFILVALVTYLGPTRVPNFLRRNTRVNHLVSGAMAGIIAGFGGVGGATILIPLFLVGKWTENSEVAPTGNAINMLTAFVSVATLIVSQQEVEWRAVFIILTSSMTLSFFARGKQHLISEKLRRQSIVIFLIGVITLQVYRAINL